MNLAEGPDAEGRLLHYRRRLQKLLKDAGKMRKFRLLKNLSRKYDFHALC